jgi:RHS repeat-associated protein
MLLNKAIEAFHNTVHHLRTGIFALSRGINFPRLFTINSNGKPYSMKLNGTAYYYELNLQGDVIGLIDSNNNVVVNYTYDSWGNLQSIGGSLAGTLGKKNPLRYRGYYYDTESGMYYLQSRYYNPEIGRFIGRDDTEYHEGDTGAAANLYAYCANNPVMNVDPDGLRAIDITSKLLNLMIKNAITLYTKARSLIRLYGHYLGKLLTYNLFYRYVRTKGAWDFKNQKSWRLNKGNYYTFMNKRVSIADVGNIHFGFVGSVLFSLLTLCVGAGLYQIYSRTSSWKFWYSFFDDPRDTKCIIIGHTLWLRIFRGRLRIWF